MKICINCSKYIGKNGGSDHSCSGLKKFVGRDVVTGIPQYINTTISCYLLRSKNPKGHEHHCEDGKFYSKKWWRFWE